LGSSSAAIARTLWLARDLTTSMSTAKALDRRRRSRSGSVQQFACGELVDEPAADLRRSVADTRRVERLVDRDVDRADVEKFAGRREHAVVTVDRARRPVREQVQTELRIGNGGR
jgi:hypothetical protein